MNALSSRYTLYTIIAIIVILLITYPAYMSSYKVIYLTNIIMYIVLTVSWVIFSGPTGYISLAPAAFFGLGIYTAAVFSSNLPLPLVIFLGGVTSFVVAFLVGAMTLRLKGMYFTMFTFGLVELIRNFAQWWETNITGTVGRLVLPVDMKVIYYIMLAILFLVVITFYLIRRSKFGLALQSIGESEEAASHVGVNVTKTKVIAFAISAFFMGITGATMTMRWQYIDPATAFDVRLSFMPVLMAIFGGMGSIYGPLIGSSIFALLEELLITKFPYYYMLLFGFIMVFVILYLPYGLEEPLGRWIKRRKREVC